MSTMTAAPQNQPLPVPRGLKGLQVTETAIGDVRGAEGFFHYRQFSATDLAASRSLEDVWQLMVDGALPSSPAEQQAFATAVSAMRHLPPAVATALPAIAGAASDGSGPLDGLRTAVSLTGLALGLRPMWDLTPTERRHDLQVLAAVTPTLVAALHRLTHGSEPIEPDPELGHAANYLWMVTGERPEPRLARAVEQYLILTVDHGFNNSTFTARVITSTGADAAAAITGALGALSGPLHGGAPSRALDTLDAIGSADRAADYVRAAVARGERIMGFGHAVYRTEDPRSAMLRQVATSLGGPLADLAVAVEPIIERTLNEHRPDARLYANVEYYAGVVMDRCGLPRELFTPTFAISRVIGWCANILEQAGDRQIIRPAARYVGPPPPEPVPSV